MNLNDRALDQAFLAEQAGQRTGPLVAILPGSRTQEVTREPAGNDSGRHRADSRNGPAFGLQWPVCMNATKPWRNGSSPRRWRVKIRGLVRRSRFTLARTPELIRLAQVAWAVSGSVGLELMVEALPSVVLYKVKRFDLWVARWFIKAKYISLVNLMADEEVFPEYLTWRDVSGELATGPYCGLTTPRHVPVPRRLS